MTAYEFMELGSINPASITWLTENNWQIFYNSYESFMQAEDPDTAELYDIETITNEEDLFSREVVAFERTSCGFHVRLDITPDEFMDSRKSEIPEWVIDFIVAIDNALSDAKKACGLS